MNALLAALYLQGGVAVMAPSMNPHRYGYQYWRWDVTEVHNPYGIVEIGLESDPARRFQVQFALRHASSIPVTDRGQNSIELRVKWKPFQK